LISVAKPGTVADDDAAEGSTTGNRGQHRDARDSRDSRGSGGRGGKMTKEQKKAQRGQNKARKFGKVRDDFDLCWKIANGSICEFGDELSTLITFFSIPGVLNFLTDVGLRTMSRRILHRKHTIYVFPIVLNSQIHRLSLRLKNL